MKRSLLKLLGCTAVLAASLSVLACKQDVPEYSRTDTVITLGTPSVKGTAYPGVNYVYWDNVANAKEGYEYEVYKDGKLSDSSWTSGNYIVDTDLDYNVKKTYKVRAKCSSNARTLYFIEGNFGSVDVTPIVPDYDTKPTDLVLYEKGYNEDKKDSYLQTQLSESQLKFQISSENVKVTKNDKENKFTVTFPAKAYLAYELYLEGNGDVWNDLEQIGSYSDLSVTDKMVSISSYVTKAGTYKLLLKVKACNNKYYTSEIIDIPEVINYEAVELESDITAKNITAQVSATSVALEWAPVKYADGSVVPAADYVVYRKVVDSNVYEKVTAEIKTKTVGLGSTAKTYYLEDEVDTTKSYTYGFVISKDGKYSATASLVTVSSYGVNAVAGDTAVTSKYISANTVRVQWTPDVLSNGDNTTTDSYSVYRKLVSAPDSEYELLEGTIEVVNTIFGETLYYIDSSVLNNAAEYVYVVMYKDGETLYRSSTTLYPYVNSIVASTQEISPAYVDAETVKVVWTPATLANGSKAATTAYDVYRKVQGAEDSTYEKVSATVESTVTVFGTTTYSVTETIADNSVAYVYLVLYKDNGTTYKAVKTLNAYTNSIRNGNTSATISYADETNIKIVWVPETLSNGAKAPKAAYKLYRKVLNAADDSYVLVSASITEEKSIFGATSYVVTDAVADNTQAYVYVIFYTNDGVTYKTEKTIAAYAESIENRAGSISAAYIAENTVRVEWTPDNLADGTVATTADYKVYRKLSNASDSAYVLVNDTTIKSETTIFGVTKYYIDSLVNNNSVKYDFALIYTDACKLCRSVATVNPYSVTSDSLRLNASLGYETASTVRFFWNPTKLANGSVAATSAYKVYRKVQGTNDAAYEEVTAAVEQESSIFGTVRYGITETISDNTVSYVYLVTLYDAGKTYTYTSTLSAYNPATPSSSSKAISAGYVADKKVRVIWTPDTLYGKTLATTDYKLYRKEYYSAAETYELVAEAVKQSVRVNPTTSATEVVYYVENTVSDDTVIYEYVLMYTLNANSYYTTTSVSKTVTSPSPIAAAAGFYTADKDNLNNDAWVSLTVSPVNQIDYIKYIISDDANAKYIAADFEDELSLSNAYVLTADGTIEYEFTISDVAGGSYVYVATSVDGAYTCIRTTGTSASAPSVAVENITISDINLVTVDEDGFANDVFFTIKTENTAQKVTVKVAKAESEFDAKQALKSVYAETIATDLTGYTYYEFDSETYAALKNLEEGTLIAVTVTVTEADKKAYVSDPKVSAKVNHGSTIAPAINSYSIVDYDRDGIFNDGLFTVIASDTKQTITVTYAVSKKSTEDAEKLLNSSKANVLTPIEVATTGRTSYNYVIRNAKNGTYIAVKAVASEAGKADSSVIESTAVSLTGTKAIISTDYSDPLTQANNIGLCVNRSQLDSEYDSSAYMGIAVLEYQTLDSIEYAYGPTKEIAKAMLDNSDVVQEVNIPSDYDLIFNDTDRAVVRHVYRMSYESISDIPLGNYIAVRANVSQNGFAVEPTVITTSVATYREAVSKPGFSVNDLMNYEYVKIVLTDTFDTAVHRIDSYTYTIERVLESNYRKEATTWETVKTLENSYDGFVDVYGDGSYYSFVMYQSYPDVKFGERYLYRVVKTRKATGEKNGSDKTVIVSRNTVAPELVFTGFESENITISATEVFDTNYDRLDKWNYELKYYVDYSLGTNIDYPDYHTVQNWEWEADLENPGTYIMKNAVISGIDHDYFDNTKAILNVVLVKTRADDYYNEYSLDTGWIDSSETIQAVLNWEGFSLNFNPDAIVGLSDETYAHPINYTFTVNTGFDEYKWYLDGEKRYEGSNQFDFAKADLINGAHDILVICKKDGITYSDSITFIK